MNCVGTLQLIGHGAKGVSFLVFRELGVWKFRSSGNIPFVMCVVGLKVSWIEEVAKSQSCISGFRMEMGRAGLAFYENCQNTLGRRR